MNDILFISFQTLENYERNYYELIANKQLRNWTSLTTFEIVNQ